MATLWGDLSKEEKAQYENKKDYNRNGPGESILPKFNQEPKATPEPASTTTATPAPATDNSNQVEAKERAQTFSETSSTPAATSSNNSGSFQPASGSVYGTDRDWSKVTKDGAPSDEIKNDPRLQEMVVDPWTGETKNAYSIMYSSGNIVKNPGLHTQSFVDKMEREGKTYVDNSNIYAPENYANKTGFGAEGNLTAKQVEDMGYTPELYKFEEYQQHPNAAFDDPNSHEAIVARQTFEGVNQYHTGDIDKRLSNNNNLDVYDPSVNEGYGDRTDPFQRMQNYNAEQVYRKELDDQGIEFQKPQNYYFDASRGYYVPNEYARQNRAASYDNMYMREPQNLLTDRNTYIHRYYDPLAGVGA